MIGHNPQVHGIKHRHHKDSRKQIGYAQFRVDERCHKTRGDARKKRDDQRNAWRDSVSEASGKNAATKRERAVHGHVAEIQHSVRHKNAEHHNSVNQTFDENSVEHFTFLSIFRFRKSRLPYPNILAGMLFRNFLRRPNPKANRCRSVRS